MNKPTIEILTTEVALIFKPLERLNSYRKITSFVNELGWQFNEGVELELDLTGLINSVQSLIDKISELSQAQEDDEKLSIALEILEDVKYLINEINDVIPQIKTAIERIPDFIGETVDMIPTLLKRLLDYLIYIYCQRYHPRIFAVLHVLGILEIVEDSVHMPIKTVQWERILKLFYNQQSIFQTIYGWNDGNNNIKSEEFFSRIEVFMRAFLLPGGIYIQKDSIREVFDRANDDNKELRIPIFQGGVWPDNYMELDLNLCPIPADGGKKAGFALYPYFFGNLDIVQEVAENWLLSISGSIEPKDAALCLKFRAPHELELVTDLFTEAPTENFNGAFEVGITRTSSPDSMIYIFGQGKGSHLALKEASVKFKATSQRDTPEFSATLNVKDFTIAINPGSDGDGFIQKLLSGINIKSVSELGIGVSNIQGVFFEGSSALEIKIPTHLELGPINIDSATVGISIDNSDFGVLLASDFSANLGPLFAGVEDIGLTIPLSFPEGGGGNLGPVQISAPKFKPPKGVALSIDAKVVKGAGYLFIDADRGEYAGAMELTFQDFLSLKAIGLINTIMPDGSTGFSMLIIITAEFTIQIGMGFVFLGAGGLLGLHRTAKLTPLAEGVRSGATANILFPTNVVENAPQIISDIKLFFPIQQNHFLIGPMIKLGYGQPALISLMLGVIIEIKTDDGGNLERIAILGVVKCILPEKEAAVLVLQVNFIGAVDFTTNTGFFFAAIYESRILSFTIEGEMGLLIAWGSNSDFLVSAGGFHPGFDPPKLPFPVPKRVSLSLLNTSTCKIRAEGYFAITTNTVQFGSKIQISLGFSDFKVEGHLAFDALFQFNPFFFTVSISGKVSLRIFGFDCFTISLSFTLKGPTRFNAKGHGKIKILFFSFKARFDKTWGASKNTSLPPVEVMPVLLAELNNPQNWEALPPASGKLLVSVRDLSHLTDADPELLVLHPVGKITVIQRAIPLERELYKVGNQKPSDANRFVLKDLESNDSGLNLSTRKTVSFAPGQFFKLSKSEKLSSPATKKYTGGQEIIASDGSLRTHGTAVRHVRYELVTIDTAYKREPKQFYQTLDSLFRVFLRNNAAARFGNSWRNRKEAVPFDELVTVVNGDYMVTYTRDNTPYQGEDLHFNNEFEAEEYLQTELAANAELGIDDLQIIPASEVNIDENIFVL
jgi:hypothetical protein